jgi:tetratricopeptide (TPR) repeat protein
VLLAVVGGSATTIAVQYAANRRLDAKNLELDRANAGLHEAIGEKDRANAALAAANNRVQARYDLAVDAIKSFHTGVSEDFLLQQIQFKELRDRLLKSAADFYGKLAAVLGKETDISSRRALAASNFELAGLTGKVGRKEEALAVHRAVLAAREALATEPGAGAGAKVDVGRSLSAVAKLLYETGAVGEALATDRRSESLLAGLTDADPSARAVLAGERAQIGFLLTRAGDRGAARAAHEAAMADRRALAAAHPDGIKEAIDLAYSLDVYGHFQQATGQNSEALASFREGRAIMDRAAKAEPAVMSYRDRLAHLMDHVATLLFEAGDYPQAEVECRAALAIRQNLADANPAVTSFQLALSTGYNNIGHVLRMTGKPAEALAAHRKGLVIAQNLAAANPAATSFQMHVAGSYNNIGLVLSRTGDLSGALEAQRKALSIRQRLVDTDPADTSHKIDQGWCHNEIGQLLLRTGKPVEALEEYDKALSLYRKLADASSVASALGNVARCQMEIGHLHLRKGKPAEALQEYQKALGIFQELADDQPTVPGFQLDLATSHNYIGRLHAREKRFTEAFAALDRCLAMRQKLADADPENTRYKSDLGWGHAYRGWAHVRAGHPAEAAADLRRALALWDKAKAPDPGNLFERARALTLLAGLAADGKSGVSAAEAAVFADQAVAPLRDALQGGYGSLAELKEPDFDPLRDTDDFKKLVAEMEAKAGPRAKPKD